MDTFDYAPLIALLADFELADLAQALPRLLERGLDESRYGDIPRWRQALEQLPELSISSVDLRVSAVRAGVGSDVSVAQAQQLESGLRGLHPWRKGPFEIAGVGIDTEWRSDMKWQRLCNSIDSLEGRRVLDIGCGNGYHCWRMAGEKAALVIGVDPTPLFVMQFWALQKYLQNDSVWLLPARCEDLPKDLQGFDTVFSMGVLYHRRSPFDHLQELRGALAADGQLVLETLVIQGGEGEVLVPQGRYSKMGNVWFIPSVPTLCSWLRKMKFGDIEVVDISRTTTDEQRPTDWMTFHSLAHFLDAKDPQKTVEGHPAPQRAIVTARL